jgi:transcriptional regulator with XRE-family HTH domain
MAEPKKPTWRARFLGRRLRELRDNRGLSLEDVAERLSSQNTSGGRVSKATLNRMELGLIPPTPEELTWLMTLYGVSDRAIRSQYRQLAEDVAQRGWWDLASDQIFADYAWAESNAEGIDSFLLTAIAGPLQAPEFAEALIRSESDNRSKAETELQLEIRLERGQLLHKSDPPQARYLLYEAALRQRFQGIGDEVYAIAFRYLLELAKMKHVKLRCLPVGVDTRALTNVGAGFTVLRMRDEWPTLVHVETPIGAVVGEPPDIDWAVSAFEQLWNEGAQDEKQTTRVLEEMLREVEK